MATSTVTSTCFIDSAKELVREAFHGPPQGQGSWFTDYRPGSGLLAMLGGIDAATASRRAPGCRNTIAGHTGHLRFYLDLIIRTLSGENAFATADWSQSWVVQQVTDAEWTGLRNDLRSQSERVLAGLRADAEVDWSDHYILTGTMALPAHLAYHLGAIRHLALILGNARD